MTDLQIPTIDVLMSKYKDVPISVLKKDKGFIQAVTKTGENLSLFLTRRFSFRQPKLMIRHQGENSQTRFVHIDMVYGINNRTTLYTIEREDLSNSTEEPVIIFLKEKSGTLGQLEEGIRTAFQLPNWKMDKEQAERDIREFFTNEQPYSFNVSIMFDTLSHYGEVKFLVMLDYININDVIRMMVEEQPYLAQELERCYHMEDPAIGANIDHTNYTDNLLPIAIKYKRSLEFS